MSSFAVLFGNFVQASGLKQKHIAQNAHISYNYLLRLLAGDRNPSELVVQKLAEAIRLSSEQTTQLLFAAGYAPSLDFIQNLTVQENNPDPVLEENEATQLLKQWYILFQSVPESSQRALLEEMKHLLGYTRYKYLLGVGKPLVDIYLASPSSEGDSHKKVPYDHVYLDMIAALIRELYEEPEEILVESEEEYISLTNYPLIEQLFAEEMVKAPRHAPFITQMLHLLQQGVSWQVRYQITKALPSLAQLDSSVTEHLMNILRFDLDDTYNVDIRRRVIEALPVLVDTSFSSLSTAIKLLHPVANDDIYVALATIEACGDIHVQIKRILTEQKSEVFHEKLLEDIDMMTFLQHSLGDIAKIQRQLLTLWENREHESIQFSLSLHDLLRAPDTLLLSLEEGLRSDEKLFQFVATRYLERLLPIRSLEVLSLYKEILEKSVAKNVRRSVAKALPGLLHCLEETSLPTRISARTIIMALATDADIYTRRAVADYLTSLLHIDREFLLILLRQMQYDSDKVIRQRLQSATLQLAQVWLTWYAETAGLMKTKPVRSTSKRTTSPRSERK